jgi:hypothetical protein
MPIRPLAPDMTSDATPNSREASWTLPYAARLGSSVRSKGLYMQIRSHLPKALQKALTIKGGELKLRMAVDATDEFDTAYAIVSEALMGLEDRPVIPREIEDILGISSAERRRWLADGRLPSAGTRTVKLRGRGTITFHVFDPAFVAEVLSGDLIVEWREHDAEAAAERRRQATWKARQKRLQKADGANERTETPNDVDDAPRLLGWKEFAKTGLP